MRARLFLLTLTLLASVAPLLRAAAQGEKPKVALVIGNAAYAAGPLPNCVHDAREVGEAFKRLGFRTTVRTDLDQKTMVRLIEAWSESLEGTGTAAFYFSGHGVAVNGRNYLVPLEARIRKQSDVELEAVDVQRVLNELQERKPGVGLVILDACRDNPLPVVVKSQTKGLIVKGGPLGTLVAFAASDGQVAQAPENARLSLYTEELLRHLESPGLRLEDIFNRTRTAVLRRSNGTQEPEERTKLGDLPVVLRPGEALAPVVATDTRGVVRVNTIPPGALTFVEGKTTGKRTPTDVTVEVGAIKEKEVEISVQLPGYHDEVRLVKVARGGTVPLEIRFRARVVQPPIPPSRDVQRPSPVKVDSKGRRAGTVKINPKDGAEMVWVPAGEFPMGSLTGRPDESPVHRVRISKGFWIYKHEVTVGQYQKFITATKHRAPGIWQNSPRFRVSDLPVVDMVLADATAYCRWAGGRLPTEAEWEYAAAGPAGLTYPWGDREPTDELAVFTHDFFEAVVHQPQPVGSKPEGKSWCGALDLTGNVSEWCADRYDQSYYRRGPSVDPQGPPSGVQRVARGGSWLTLPTRLRVSYREPILSRELNLMSLGIRPVVPDSGAQKPGGAAAAPRSSTRRPRTKK